MRARPRTQSTEARNIREIDVSEFRGPHDLRAGDRVLVVDAGDYTGSMRAGEIRTVRYACGDRVDLVGSDRVFNRERFLRITEPGEVVPRGAVTRLVGCAIVGDRTSDSPFSGRLTTPRVVVSVPPVESERERKMRELGEQIEKLQAKYDDLAGVGE